jgi:hypothetical protein
MNCSVVNPNDRLKWITEHWGEGDEYYKRAIKTIKDTVSRNIYHFIALLIQFILDGNISRQESRQAV